MRQSVVAQQSTIPSVFQQVRLHAAQDNHSHDRIIMAWPSAGMSGASNYSADCSPNYPLRYTPYAQFYNYPACMHKE